MTREIEDELAAVITAYEEGTLQLRTARDEAIRTAAAKGLRQVDIVRVTGYNRETIRQIVSVQPKRVNTDRMRARAEAVRDAAAEREAAERHEAFLRTPLGQHIVEMGQFFNGLGKAFSPFSRPDPTDGPEPAKGD